MQAANREQIENSGLAGEGLAGLVRPAAAVSRVERWKAFYELSKPGITKMVVLAASASYYLALENAAAYFAQLHNVVHFFFTVIGTTLVSGGACALNNYIERDIDARMKRTAERPIPSGKLLPNEALIFGLVLVLMGLFMLSFINVPTVILALATLVGYIAVYTPLKRVSVHNTLVGAVPGAIPMLGGWVAVSGSIDVEAVALFLILFFWQMPHFLALSWMYRKDYAVPGFKMLAVLDEQGTTLARQTLVYTACLLPATLALTALGLTGPVFAAGAVALTAFMLWKAIAFLREVSVPNARKVLYASYLFLMGVVVLMFADKA